MLLATGVGGVGWRASPECRPLRRSQMFGYVCNVVFPCLGILEYDQAVYDKAAQDLATSLATLNAILAPRTYLVGEHLTLVGGTGPRAASVAPARWPDAHARAHRQADVCMACSLMLAYAHVLDAAGRAPYTHVSRWFTTCVNQAAERAPRSRAKSRGVRPGSCARMRPAGAAAGVQECSWRL